MRNSLFKRVSAQSVLPSTCIFPVFNRRGTFPLSKPRRCSPFAGRKIGYRRRSTQGYAPMPIINRIADFHPDLTAWRHDIHAHPETAFEEHRTADFVADRLAEFGIEVHRGLPGTGVVGTLEARVPGGRAIALRADMDSLPVHE